MVNKKNNETKISSWRVEQKLKKYAIQKSLDKVLKYVRNSFFSSYNY